MSTSHHVDVVSSTLEQPKIECFSATYTASRSSVGSEITSLRATNHTSTWKSTIIGYLYGICVASFTKCIHIEIITIQFTRCHSTKWFSQSTISQINISSGFNDIFIATQLIKNLIIWEIDLLILQCSVIIVYIYVKKSAKWRTPAITKICSGIMWLDYIYSVSTTITSVIKRLCFPNRHNVA